MRQRIIQTAGAGRQPLTALSNSPKYSTLYCEPWDDVQAGRVQAAAAGMVDADALHARYGDNADGPPVTTGVAAAEAVHEYCRAHSHAEIAISEGCAMAACRRGFRQESDDATIVCFW